MQKLGSQATQTWCIHTHTRVQVAAHHGVGATGSAVKAARLQSLIVQRRELPTDASPALCALAQRTTQEANASLALRGWSEPATCATEIAVCRSGPAPRRLPPPPVRKSVPGCWGSARLLGSRQSASNRATEWSKATSGVADHLPIAQKLLKTKPLK